jgi:hypothetical protein
MGGVGQRSTESLSDPSVGRLYQVRTPCRSRSVIRRGVAMVPRSGVYPGLRVLVVFVVFVVFVIFVGLRLYLVSRRRMFWTAIEE